MNVHLQRYLTKKEFLGSRPLVRALKLNGGQHYPAATATQVVQPTKYCSHASFGNEQRVRDILFSYRLGHSVFFSIFFFFHLASSDFACTSNPVMQPFKKPAKYETSMEAATPVH